MIDTQSSKEPSSLLGEIKQTIPLTEKTVKNNRNMPSMIFIENVEDFAERYTHEAVVEEVNIFYR